MIKTIKSSLANLLSKDYLESVINANVMLFGANRLEMEKLAYEEVDFLPGDFMDRANNMLQQVGSQVITPMSNSIEGAPTDAYKNATNLNACPISGMAFYRIGEDGRLYLTAKSEHYHTPVGHAFPGFKLLDYARKLNITNATHNNTRGFITRYLETELIRTINGISKDDTKTLDEVLKSKQSKVLNRVINLETGSLACEAGIKMLLSRFYQCDSKSIKPIHEDKIPVFFVIADNEGKNTANYHGTTIIAQTFRGLWPEFYSKCEESDLYKVCPVRINDIEDFKNKVSKYNHGKYKIAGFIHEIIMMNYGAIKLEKVYLNEAYRICKEEEIPTMVDEIQSCMWYPSMFLFIEYGLKPDIVTLGKGFSGGQYPASRIVTTFELDNLNQFGALVTNAQEELASLSYLITMEFTQNNGAHITEIGEYYFNALCDLAKKYPLISKIEGLAHLASICFDDISKAVEFAKMINQRAIDISAQTYKANCTPAVLTKIPIISTKKMVDFMIENMQEVLEVLQSRDKGGEL